MLTYCVLSEIVVRKAGTENAAYFSYPLHLDIKTMKNTRFSVIVIYILLFLINLPFSNGQDVSKISELEEEYSIETNVADPLKILIDVREVRLDVVVVDNKGRPITDLTAADFEVYQDRLPQGVTSSIYIENQVDVVTRPAASRKDAPNLTRFPVTTLKEEEVRRTIVFVVDNISMKYKHLTYAKRSMKGFVENQMQPGDMVAIMSTSSGNSALNFFSSDKSQIFKKIDHISHEGPGDFIHVDEGHFHRMYGNQLSTLSYSIRALKDMPGRKIILFLSAYPTIKKPPPVIIEAIPFDFYELYGPRFERLADDALRAGVVVHAMNTMGLRIEAEVNEPSEEEESYNALNPLPVKTGGTYIDNSNFFLDGIGKDMNNMIAGYYLVSYIPPSTTFKASRKDVFHRVEVKVKRRGATVYTRDGFYGRLEGEEDSASPPVHPLQDAIFSPFRYADLDVNIAAGYVKDEKTGYLVRSWIHLDPKDVTIAETDDGGASIDLQTVILTSDTNGYVQDFREVKYTFSFTPEKKLENLVWIQKHGIRFLLTLPVKKPGYYTVRVAVQDTESGKVGTAYQSVEIPDLDKIGLALSDVFLITSAEDITWMFSDAAEESDDGVFSAVFQEGEVRSPALRTYMPGDNLQTLAILYNADAEEIARSEIEIQSILYKDGKEFQRGEAVPIAIENAGNSDGIAILRRFTIGLDMPPGDYILQLLVTDKKNSVKRDNEGVAVQNEGGSLFLKIFRAYINKPKFYIENIDKGVASQTLGFKVKEQ